MLLQTLDNPGNETPQALNVHKTSLLYGHASLGIIDLRIPIWLKVGANTSTPWVLELSLRACAVIGRPDQSYEF